MSGAGFPTLFISHGAPTLPLDRSHPTHAFLKHLGASLPRPEAILVVSAHWDTKLPTLTTAAVNGTFHDFYGFPEELYALRYPAPGAPELAEKIMKMLDAAGFSVEPDGQRGLDHGTWVPLLLMYPKADIPVLQLSLQTGDGTRHHLALGEALKPLRERSVLVIGSGGATHNLREFFRPMPGLDASYVPEFTGWLEDVLARRDLDALADYRLRAPQAARAHPTEEHFLPLLVAAAAGSSSGHRIHTALSGASLAMDAYRFD